MFGLVNRGELPKVVEDEFEHLALRLQHLWLVQHEADGTHDLEVLGAAAEEHTHVAADLPDEVAYTNVSNTFTVDQTIQADLTVDTGNIYMDAATAIYFGGTAATDLRYYGSATHAIIRAGSTGVTVQNNAGSTDIITVAQATGAITLSQAGGTIKERGRAAAMGDWTAYTPTWANSGATQPVIGNGTLDGQYMRIGTTVFFEVRLIIGATTTRGTVGGSYSFTTPTTLSYMGVPNVWAFDNGTGWYSGFAVNASTTTFNLYIATGASSTISGIMTENSPFTLATGDQIRISGWYLE